MKNVSILFPDQIHFHERNFKSLFDTIKKHSVKHTFITSMHHLVATFGNYFEHKEQLIEHYNSISKLNNEELFTLKSKGSLLFKIYRSEALAYFLSLSNFREKVSHADSDMDMFQLMSTTNHEALLLNISATIFWLNFWDEKLSTLKIHTYACVFSGVQIYNRTLLEKLKTHATTPLVLEHFFTGNEFYLEEKYEPIPNNTNLKYFNTYNSIQLPDTFDEYERKKIKAINKVLLSKNKNVTQPIESQLINSQGKKVVTIIGQVYNDYSIIGTGKNYLSSINFYVEIIEKLLLDESIYIVFKAHPWERNKNKEKLAPTYETIFNLREALPLDKKERLFITEDFNLSNLINQSEHIVTLCSQSAIEAAFLGVKPIQLGNAFYGEKGFTYDYTDIEDFIDDLSSGKLSRALTIKEYKNLEVFLMKFLEVELVSVHKSGINTIERKLSLYPYIKLVKEEKKNIVNEAKQEIKKILTVPTESIMTQKVLDMVTNPEKTQRNKVMMSLSTEKTVATNNIEAKKSFLRKIKKLKSNPQLFFFDSRSKILNSIGRVIFR